MPPKIDILVKAHDDATRKLMGITGKIEGMSRTFKIAGAAMVGGGLAITGALGMAVKAAAEEEAGIVKLSTSMKNMGISYEEVKGSLEDWIDAQQQKTSIADNEQRESLSSLILATGDLAEAQSLMTLAMDMSVGTGTDLKQATQRLGMALAGNWGMLQRYIPTLKDAKTEEEKWAMMRQMFSGQAEAYGKTMAGQMQLLKNNIGDVKEAIGSIVAEAIGPLFKQLSDLLPKIKEWISENPKLTKTITLATLAFGLLLIPLGTLVMALPTLVRSFTLLRGAIAATTVAARAGTIANIAFSASLWGPLGILAALAAVGIALAVTSDKWDTYKDKVTDTTTVQKELNTSQQEMGLVALDAMIAEGNLKREIKEVGKAIKEFDVVVSDSAIRLDYLAQREQNIMKINEQAARSYNELSEEIRAANLRREQDTAAALKVTTDAFEDMMERIIYTGSEAEKFGVTMFDVYDAMEKLDYKTEEIKNAYFRWGNEIGNVDEALLFLGKSAKEVNELLTEQATKLKEVEDASERTMKAAQSLADVLLGKEAAGAGYAISTEARSLTEYLGSRAGREEIERRMGETGKGKGETIRDIQEEVYGFRAYQRGGYVPETGPAWLHKGETVLPTNFTMTIPIYLDGELISEQIVKRVGGEINLQGGR